MPLAFLLLISVLNPAYIRPFIHSQTGHALMIYSVISIGIGFLILNRLVNVEE